MKVNNIYVDGAFLCETHLIKIIGNDYYTTFGTFRKNKYGIMMALTNRNIELKIDDESKFKKNLK